MTLPMLLVGLRAMAVRAEHRSDMVVLPPSKLLELLDRIEPLVQSQTTEIRGLHISDTLRLGILKDLKFKNVYAALQRMRLHFNAVDTRELLRVINKIGADDA